MSKSTRLIRSKINYSKRRKAYHKFFQAYSKVITNNMIVTTGASLHERADRIKEVTEKRIEEFFAKGLHRIFKKIK